MSASTKASRPLPAGSLSSPARVASRRKSSLLGALVVLEGEPGPPLRISEIAAALHATLPHMSKVLVSKASPIYSGEARSLILDR